MMTKIQVMGPTNKGSGPVTYQKTYTCSTACLDSKFMVTFKLGESLRQRPISFGNTPLAQVPREESEQQPFTLPSNPSNDVNGPENSPSRKPRSHTTVTPTRTDQLRQSSQTTSRDSRLSTRSPNTPTTPSQGIFSPLQKKSLVSPFLAFFSNDKQKDIAHVQRIEEESVSDLEIVEVRPIEVVPLRASNLSDDTYDSQQATEDDDLSCLDETIKQVLTSNTTIHTQESACYLKAPNKAPNMVAIHKLLPNLCRQVVPRSPPPPGFRNIPPNLVNAIQRELNFFFDTTTDDDVEVVGKMVFSLKDPITRTKIKLPIKSTVCRHFECFDFNNFCLFHELPPGTQNGLRSNMYMQSKESRETEGKFYRQQALIAEGKLLLKSPGLVFPQFSEYGQMFFTDLYHRTSPLYKCPLCDERFGLKQLYISDVFNFFVKTTPAHVTKIELVEHDRYKIVEEEKSKKYEQLFDVVDLDNDEETDSAGQGNGNTNHREQKGNGADRSISEDFNDGLDDVLVGLTREDGTWLHPVTLD